MLKKSESRRSFFRMSLIISLAFCITMSLASSSYAMGGSIALDTSRDYLLAPAVGSNVIGYLSAEYLNPETTLFTIFVRKCECLKRLTSTDSGVLITFPAVVNLDEFNSITSTALVGMIDTTGQLSAALSDGQTLIPVIEQVLEFKKVGAKFIARVSIKFVAETP